MANERIRLDMSVRDVIVAMCDGNPGAVAACAEITQLGEEIDPDAFSGGLGAFLMLDTLNIYGSRLYMLWNDVCGRDVAKTLAVLRAYQLGQLAGVTEDAINHAIDNRGEGINLDEVVKAVTARLPNFRLEVVSA
ncbi:hypothetical protein HY502_03155 [Candidatus Woesebacteria bacterium]|nr:hypothetical protein [Candidatus Woesebacteria bacterium]